MEKKKILIVSNLYPPHFLGGYEIGCGQFADYMIQKGYEVKILTSKYNMEKCLTEDNVYRQLYWDPEEFKGSNSILKRLRYFFKREFRKFTALRLLKKLKVDYVHIWNMGGIPVSLISSFNKRKIPVYVYIFDVWPAHILDDFSYDFIYGIRKNAFKKLMTKTFVPVFHFFKIAAPSKLVFNKMYYCSKFVKDEVEKKITADYPVQYWGIDLDKFKYNAEKERTPCFRLLFSGRITYEKGILVAVEVMDILIKKTLSSHNLFKLTIS